MNRTLAESIEAHLQTVPDCGEGRADVIAKDPETESTRRELIGLLPNDSGDVKILDIGPAMGWELVALRERFPVAELWGVTLFHEEAESWPKDARPLVSDMHALQIADGQFDMIYASHVLEHSAAPYIALCEMRRVLKPGGLLQIVMPEPHGVMHAGNIQRFRRHGDLPGHLFCGSMETMVTLIRHAGMEFDCYREVAQRSGGKLECWYRVWQAAVPARGR